jgi:hypothetical protein
MSGAGRSCGGAARAPQVPKRLDDDVQEAVERACEWSFSGKEGAASGPTHLPREFFMPLCT